MFKKLILAIAWVMVTLVPVARAEEGMWLPLLLKQLNEADMQKMGLKITADDIYNVNKSSLKDAIVSFGGFCTGEMISEEGLLITNHHCGFDAIQTNSSVKHDYITNGFWAMNREQELPNPGLFVRFLVRIENVTDKILSQIPDTLKEAELNGFLKGLYDPIVKEAAEGGTYIADVRPFFNGNEYYLFVYQQFNDVRLVGAPPQSIGNYGGDTDNWMWPRHTGDFSMFRVYCGKDGKPADFSKDNVPLKPKHFLPVSIKGLQKDDFTMTLGYPGRTDRYLTSYGVNQAIEKTSPAIVKIRAKKLDLMKEQMDASDKIRIAYASKYARTANYWKYFIGQTKGLKRMEVAKQKADLENKFQTWANADASRKGKYGNVLPSLKKGFGDMEQYALFRIYLNEAIMRGPEILAFAYGASGLEKMLSAKPFDNTKVKATAEALKGAGVDYFKEYDPKTDQMILGALMKMVYMDIPKDQQAPVFAEINSKYKGDFEKWAADVIAKSLFASEATYNAFLDKPSLKKLQADPAYNAISSIMDHYQNTIKPHMDPINNVMSENNRLFVAGLREMMPDKTFAPDANGTMRLSYGAVKDYYPMDAVYYNYFTTSEGILEKLDNSNEEFKVDPKLEKLLRNKDFGPYSENGVLTVCFISTNDITGGNSGSPVIDGEGSLVGLCFDGNWEAMSGDIAYDATYKRTISVDIRYVLFIIDKFAGAGHLINEMKIAN